MQIYRARKFFGAFFIMLASHVSRDRRNFSVLFYFFLSSVTLEKNIRTYEALFFWVREK